jgi:hypothetical protein
MAILAKYAAEAAEPGEEVLPKERNWIKAFHLIVASYEVESLTENRMRSAFGLQFEAVANEDSRNLRLTVHRLAVFCVVFRIHLERIH